MYYGFGEGMTLNCRGRVLDSPVMMNIDTGDAAFGTLGVSFFNANKDFIVAHAEVDTIRRGGLGGVVESRCYRIDNMPVSLGGHTIEIPGLVVETEQSSAAMSFNCNIGLRTLMMYGKVRFNLVDFVLTTYPHAKSPISYNGLQYSTPSLKFPKAYGPSVVQTLGSIALGVTKALVYPDAPDKPDL